MTTPNSHDELREAIDRAWKVASKCNATEPETLDMMVDAVLATHPAPVSAEGEREAFEAWWDGEGYEARKQSGFLLTRKQIAELAWQASSNPAASPVAENQRLREALQHYSKACDMGCEDGGIARAALQTSGDNIPLAHSNK